MLFQATLLVDLIAMAATLWGAFYLFARGFPSWITLRATVALLILSLFFLGAYNNIFSQVEGTAPLRAVLLILGLAVWYSLTFRLLSHHGRQKLRGMSIVIYLLGGAAVIKLLLTPGVFIEEQGNALYIAHMRIGFPYILYGSFQLLVVIGILYNLLAEERIGLSQQGRYFLVASFFPALAVTSGIIGLAMVREFPRVIQDMFVFGGMFLMGISVARHQTMIERRTTAHDMPVSFLTVFVLTGLYAYLALRLGMPLESMGRMIAFIILTHSLVDLAREYLERQRNRRESDFRRQLYTLENQNEGEKAIESQLQNGLELLCGAVEASGGFIAVQHLAGFSVVASRGSIEQGIVLPGEILKCDDLFQPASLQLPRITWIAPCFDGQSQVAVIGVGMPKVKLEYSLGDLDLVSEVADRVGTLISLGNRTIGQAQQMVQLVGALQSNNSEMNFAADKMMASISTSPDPEFVKLVEDCLRHYSDYAVLGQSPLAEYLGIREISHIECGKQLQVFLAESIDAFRPAGARPPEPLPRLWYSYVVLHDAYVEGVPNRELMARLYISEGTFNRTRRNALRGLARLMMERSKKAVGNS